MARPARVNRNPGAGFVGFEGLRDALGSSLLGARAPVHAKAVAKQAVRGRLAQHGQRPVGFDAFRLEVIRDQ